MSTSNTPHDPARDDPVSDIAEDEAKAEKAEAEEESIEEATQLSSRLVYEVIRRAGEEELGRTNRSLFFAGLSAGILIAFSLVAEAILRTYLPEAPWAHLVENLGYSLGFTLVILGRMQLFTENTITTVLPLMRDPCPPLVASVARLWGIVLAANVLGAFIAAAFIVLAHPLPPEVMPAILDLSLHGTGFGFWESLVRGVPAGLLVAAIVWMMPQVEESPLGVILVFTWLIAAGDFTHVVVGSVEIGVTILSGDAGAVAAFGEFWLPTLVGNIIGGTVIFTLIAWGQVRDDVRGENAPPDGHQRRRP
ncbi:formate/nitrite transporter family protein [Rhodobacterales bacterium HKCCE2091]|nr:formate/nitrite transporter family protein [Rhodobacterales bacterium HKCCE2091]